MQIIKNKEIVQDTWQTVAAESTLADIPNGDVIVPLALWLQHNEELSQRSGKIGVALTSTEAIDDITSDLSKIDTIALEFPTFNIGTHYSSARLLRDQHGYKGEIRAYGDVNRDQLNYMSRVGFDTFQLRPETNLEACLSAFSDFSVIYQASSDEPLPLYRRR